MAEAIPQYKATAQRAKEKADEVKDDDVKGLIELIAADCAAETYETPCGYQTLRGFLLPRMMRLVDINKSNEIINSSVGDTSAVRYLWIPDYNARYTLRNLHTFISAVKAQSDYSKADTA